MKPKIKFYPECQYGGFSNIDGTIIFYNRVNALLSSESIVIDFGCGRGAYASDPVAYRRNLRILKNKCQRVIGLDVNQVGRENPFLDEFRLVQDWQLPIESHSVDLFLADNVLEHLENPEIFFSECQRSIKPGGYLCIRTPNLLSYVGLLAWLIPNRKHLSILQKAKEQASELDTFPTFYRANTIARLKRLLADHGFEQCVYGYNAEPSYLSFSEFTYALGVFFHPLTPKYFKVGIHAFGQKL